MNRVNGKATIGGLVVQESEWFVNQRHCARATYKHKTDDIGKRQPRRASKTIDKAREQADWARDNVPEGTSDGEYLRMVAARFGGTGEEQGELFDGEEEG